MTDDGTPASDRSALRAWLIVLAGIVAFSATTDLASGAVRSLVGVVTATPADPRGTVVLRATASVLGLGAGFVLLIAYLRWRGRSLADLGWMRPGPTKGWIGAALFTILWVALILGSALRGRAPLLEPSWFNLYVSVVTAVGAGVVEESFFRGFVMSELELGGVGPALQVLATGLLFGLAHVSWGSLGGDFDVATAAGPVISTAIMGTAYGGIYLLSGRSLMPVVASHFFVNLTVEPWLLLAAVTGSFGGG